MGSLQYIGAKALLKIVVLLKESETLNILCDLD